MAPRGTQRANDSYEAHYAWAEGAIAEAEKHETVKGTLQWLWNWPKTDRIRRAAAQAAVTAYKARK